MTNNEIDSQPLILSPEMSDVLTELADERGMELKDVIHQSKVIMGHLSIEAS